jgi:hypothetical protein
MSNARDLVPAPDAQAQAIFDQSQEVGHLARTLFRGGIEIGNGVAGTEDPLCLTQTALAQRKPLFEAAFAYGGGYCRVDVLRPALDDAWDIIETKATTGPEDVHLHDLAFQRWVLAGTGLRIGRCFLAHLNPDYVRRGAVDPQQMFVLADVSDQVLHLAQGVGDNLDKMHRTIRLPEQPQVRIGPHCNKPYECPLKKQCWSFLPAQNVTELSRGKNKRFRLLESGVVLLKDIPADFKLTKNQEVQKAAAVTGEPQIRKDEIRDFMRTLTYPLHHFDFETLATAVPLFENVRPWEAVPFQFSVHVVDAPGATPRHFPFLAEGRDDPRPEFLACLKAALGDAGSLVAYHSSFEQGVLARCALAFPDQSAWIEDAITRIVDLELPFRKFAYCDPRQKGRSTLKLVLPALTGRGYADLAINRGDTASKEFMRITFEDVPEEERRRLRQELLDYCGRDSGGMTSIVDALSRVVAP